MKITSLALEDFRGFESFRFEPHDRMNVLVGINGSGKTSLLNASSFLLNQLISLIRSSKVSGSLSEDDIRITASRTQCSIEIDYEDTSYRWTTLKYRRGALHKEGSRFDGAKDLSVLIQKKLSESLDPASVPLLLYYPVNRAVRDRDIPLRIRTKHPFEQLDVYEESLTGSSSSFRIFFEWYRNREDIENEAYRRQPDLFNGSQPVLDPQLEAVRKAITQFMPDFSNLHVQRQPHRMVLEKAGEILSVNQLSDGEKCTLALVGDLARRLAMANPSLDNPLEGVGIVMIDEIELHLHPQWQRRVAPDLARIFPNCQFLLTTHSPQVLSAIESESIWVLDGKPKGGIQPISAYGKDSNRILEDILDTPERPQKIKDVLNELFAAVDDSDLNRAKALLSKIKGAIGDDPELTKAEVLIWRKESMAN